MLALCRNALAKVHFMHKLLPHNSALKLEHMS